jgi:hypothetical protein
LPCLSHQFDLVAHGRDRVCVGPYKVDHLIRQPRREIRVLREEAVSRVDSLRSSGSGGLDDSVQLQMPKHGHSKHEHSKHEPKIWLNARRRPVTLRLLTRQAASAGWEAETIITGSRVSPTTQQLREGLRYTSLRFATRILSKRALRVSK